MAQNTVSSAGQIYAPVLLRKPDDVDKQTIHLKSQMIVRFDKYRCAPPLLSQDRHQSIYQAPFIWIMAHAGEIRKTSTVP
jgi:hypothetical protein